jgi:anti-sigma regulatory factor (Ser/Thr protein kinase)
VKLALCELLANTISYGYEDYGPHVIHVLLELRDESVHFEIMDDGIAFDPTRAETHSRRDALKDLPTGGYGVHLTRSFVDTISYSRKDGRNHVTATKRICGPQS